MLIVCKVLNKVQRQLINYKIIRVKSSESTKMERNADDSLEVFHRVCNEIGTERSYLSKSRILQDFLRKGTDKKGFKGDTLLWIQLLLPGTSQRVYNLQNKQMLKLFSRLFVCNQQDMQHDLEQEGDVSETLRKFFEASPKLKPQSKSTMYLQDVEEFLQKLEQKTKEDEQSEALRQLCRQATSEDLKMIIRMIKQDLRINAGARHILDAFGPFAYPAYQSSRDLAAVVKQFSKKDGNQNAKVSPKAGKKGAAKVGHIQVMTPISPMLANACKSVEEAFKKSPGGLFSEIKYDGERVQIHKRGNEFKFFSRNLKPVMEHKVKRFKEFIPKAFPSGGNMILDSEIILVDTVTGELLPFGTLGAHKKKEFAKAEVCLFVFDCILYDGEDLTNLSFRERRKILEDNIKPIKSYVQLSESHFLKTKNELAIMTAKVLKANLEGVVLKCPTGTYQPGKRNWLKVKKDYLFDGKMADTADLVVLGGSFGSGKKGGILSIFLMGCYDRRDDLWKTVTKVHGGLDDATQEEMHEKLMKLMERPDPNRLPTWLLCKKSLIPDYIAKSPEDMPVWEITGAEFTSSESHTAAGISIRFPRITRLRDDKSAHEANDLEYLQKLYEASKNSINVDLLLKNCTKGDGDEKDDKDASMQIDSKCSLNLSPKKRQSTALEDGDDEDNEKPSSKRIKNDASPTSTEEPADKVKIEKKTEKTPLKDNNKTPTQKKGKQLKLNFSTISRGSGGSSNSVKVEKAEMIVPESDLFEDYVAFFAEHKDYDKYKQQILKNGGAVTMNPKDATIILYETTQPDVQMDEIRHKYKYTARHLSVDWVRDCIAEKECLPFAMYAAVLNKPKAT